MNVDLNRADIFSGDCGDLNYFYDENKYSRDQFQEDYNFWLSIRKKGGISNYLLPVSNDNLSNAEKIRIKRRKNLDIQGFHNFESIICISTSKFLAEFLYKFGVSNLNDTQKEYLQNLLSGTSSNPLQYIGLSGKTLRISSDAISLANRVVEDLLEKQTLHQQPRLTAKVYESYTARGFISEIFKNEVRDFFYKIPTNKKGFEIQLVDRVKEITTESLSEKSKLKKYIDFKTYSFFENGNGFSLSKKDLDSNLEDLPIEIFRQQLSILINIISKKATLPKPTMENSTINPDLAETPEEFEEKLDQLIHVSSRWKVFSGPTLANILFETASEIKFVRYSLMNEAFKQSLSVYQFVPQNTTELNPNDDSNQEEIDDLRIKKQGIKYLTESREFNLSGYCEIALFENLESLKEDDFEKFEIFINYLSVWVKLTQSNLYMENSMDTQKEIKDQIGKQNYKISFEIYENQYQICKSKQLELDGTDLKELSYFSGLLKYLALNTSGII